MQPQAKTDGEPQVKAKASTKGARVTDLRGDYDWHRANNDLLYYHLDIRVDPEKKSFGGKNTIKFRMLKNDCGSTSTSTAVSRSIRSSLATTPLKYERDARAVFVDFPETAQARPGLRHRLLLLRPGRRRRPVWRDLLP